MKQHKIAVIAGDGIGKEAMPEGMRVLEAADTKFGIGFQFDVKPWSCDYYLKHGVMMSADGLAEIRHHDAIFLGAMMLERLGQKAAADAIVHAVETVLTDGPRTSDMGGTASTIEVGRAIAAAL